MVGVEALVLGVGNRVPVEQPVAVRLADGQWVKDGHVRVGQRIQPAAVGQEVLLDIVKLLDMDTEIALSKLDQIPISIQCWQGDDVRGFENPEGDLTGGIQASGNYPGRARNGDELRADAEVAFAQIPGAKRFSLHAIYLESDAPVERDAIEPKVFRVGCSGPRSKRLVWISILLAFRIH